MITKILVLLLVLPFANASILPDDCGEFSGWKLEECRNILGDSSLSTIEKEDLYLNLRVEQEELGSFDFVYNWNKQLNFRSIPSGVEAKSNGIIKDAWVKLVSVNKSYYDLNKSEWFVQHSGEALSAYSYSIELPTGTEQGDCRTRYSHELLNEELNIRLNGTPIGSEKISHYSVGVVDGQAMGFKAGLFVKTRLRVDHYREHSYCGRFGIPPVYYCYNVCEYSHTDYRENHVSVQDNFNAKTKDYSLELEASLKKNKGFNELLLEVSSSEPFNGFELKYGDSGFYLSESNFDIAAGENDTLHVTKTYGKSKKPENLIEQDYSESGDKRNAVLWTENNAECSYTFYSDFEQTTNDCGLTELKNARVIVETDYNTFDLEDDINASVTVLDDSNRPLANKVVLFRAGNQTKELTTNENGIAGTTVNAGESNGIIQASLKGNKEYQEASGLKRVPVTNEKSTETGKQVATFFISYYVVFLIAKKAVLGVF